MRRPSDSQRNVQSAGGRRRAAQAAKAGFHRFAETGAISLFLCGDVMTGRGIDQVLPHPGDPRLHEPHVQDAREYLRIAERAHGPIRKPVEYSYIWGEALEELKRQEPDIRLINLETAVTTAGEPAPDKGIHYRMHPENIPCLTAAAVDGCCLANNHVLDWGTPGLLETMESLGSAGIRVAGAGRNREEAAKPAAFPVRGKGRVLLFAAGSPSSGVPSGWAANESSPGVCLLPDFSAATLGGLAAEIRGAKGPGDIVVVSIHWGGNWGYEVPEEHRAFARGLVEAGADLVWGHSSHHPRPLEVYKDRLILYGCGDLINDYEGIRGYERFRDDLVLMYFPRLDNSGRLLELQMTPFGIERFRLERASRRDAAWLRDTLNRRGGDSGSGIVMGEDGRLYLRRSP